MARASSAHLPRTAAQQLWRDLMPVLRLLGLLIVYFGVSMLPPLAVALWLHDGMAPVFLGSACATLLCGLLLWRQMQRLSNRELQPRHGIFLVVLTWSVLPFFAALPLWFGLGAAGWNTPFAHAFYEAASGLTTTGGTALSRLDELPPSINFWRCFLQWQGGMGILVLVVAVLPLLGMGGSQLFRAESAGPMKETKLTPRIAETAKGLWYVYATLSLLCALGYWLAGMEPLDAVMHMFTTVSLGGMSSHDASLAHFQSFAIEMVAMLTMLVASCNFALYFSAIAKKRVRIIWRNPELRVTLACLLGGGLLVSLLLVLQGKYPLAEALRLGMFNTISVATTTGYATTDYEQWPVFAPVFMLLLSCFATSAGSTGGGAKTLRVLVLVQQIRHELNQMVHPRAVHPAHIGGVTIPAHLVRAVLAYIVLYGATVLLLMLTLLLTGLDVVSAFSAALASVNCVGPGLGQVGPMSNYATLSDVQLWACSMGMILGRLELLSFYALLLPSYWRR